jgi:hypothetical protein
MIEEIKDEILDQRRTKVMKNIETRKISDVESLNLIDINAI